MAFMQKLMADPTNPSLHVEPINNSRDKRVRTGRINKQYRAVMFELTGHNDKHFVLIDVCNHDEAYELAATVSMRSNPVSGVTQLSFAETPSALSSVDISAEVESRAKKLAAEKIAAAAVAEAAADATDVVDTVDSVDAVAPAVSISDSPGKVLTEAGLTQAILEEQLGISPVATAVVFAVDDERDLDSLLADSPQWELDAILSLVAGFSIEQVRHDLSIEDTLATKQPEESDEVLLEGLHTPAAAMEFAYAPDEDALKAIIETRDFNAWRIFVHPSQKAVIDANFSGSGRVFGGAGTGKTVVAIHRANELVTRRGQAPTLGQHSPRVLLTTYTRTLSESLKSQMNVLNPRFPEASTQGAPGLWISGIDSLVFRVLKYARNDELAAAVQEVLGIEASVRPGPLDSRDEQEIWEQSLTLAAVELVPEKANPEFLSQEYSTVVLAGGITQQADYLRVPRPGRGTSLNRRERKAVWKVMEVFTKKCVSQDRFTWPMLAVLAAEVLTNRDQPKLFDHVIIDEAQDFHAGHWRFLRACVAEGPNDIFLAEDSHQRIYGQRLVLSRFGISTRGRASRRLSLNYRTTAQNLDYAVAILDGQLWHGSTDELDSTVGYRSSRQGPAPILARASNLAEERSLAIEQIKQWLEESPDAHVGVLTRTKFLVKQIVAQFREAGLNVVETRQATAAAEAEVSVMTMHSAKGLEFTHVVLLDVNENSMPRDYQLHGLGEAEVADVLQRERALLYVAASRARDALMITTSDRPSTLLPA
ncbi:3'-5' exonuclease [Corynebacterium alimapuense]|nr:3'-5' exonuclease [Corynebacterium alimapuense]